MLVVVLAGSLATGDKTIGTHRREKWVDEIGRAHV